MNSETSAYGLWSLVVLNSAIFLFFAFSFTRPNTPRDWRAFGGFAAFIVALFTEMYGVPLTIYLLAGWLGNRYPGIDLLSHNTGHLWDTLVGWKGDPHLSPIHIASNLLTVGGFLLVGNAWGVLYQAQRAHRLATTGLYARIRHPQYLGFIIIMFSFLLQWPTVLTLVMFPILIIMYVRLARREEREAIAQFGDEYLRYMAVTPAFIPRRRPARPVVSTASHP